MPARPALAALLAAALAVGLAACGGGGGESAQTTTAPTTTRAAPPLELTVYFLRDGRVSPVRVRVAHTQAVANAALDALVAGPPEGYDTAVPESTKADVTSVDHGVAKVDVDKPLDDRGNAQLVYTLTAVPRVGAVEYPDLVDPDTGAEAGRPLTRAAFERFVPPILVERPLPHDGTGAEVRVLGTASVFEATLVVKLRQDGALVQQQTVTATEGAPGRGEFLSVLRGATAGPATVVAYAPNAAGGAPLHRVEVPIEVTP